MVGETGVWSESDPQDIPKPGARYMNTHETIQASLNLAREVTNTLLADLSDEDLLNRPVPGANHIAWQLGHLICSEHSMMAELPESDMPALPDGFAEKYKKETSNSDDPSHFESKQTYLDLYGQVRGGTLATLERLSDDRMSESAPDAYREMFKTVGALVSLQASHELMHVGQYTVVRRQLGKAVAF